MGANLWSAGRCLEAFKKLSKESFKQLPFSKIPVLGLLLSLKWDSYYDPSAIEQALRNTFGPTGTEHRFFFSEPNVATDNSDFQTTMRDLKVGVTAVNVIGDLTTLMTNYNRKIDNGGKLTSDIFEVPL